MKGYKQNKERLTIIFCVNASGTEKIQLTIVGNAKKPHCFKDFNVNFYCNYIHTKKAWLNKIEFQKWLYKFDVLMKRNNRKIILLVDNAPAHMITENFANIKLLFLPKNSTGFLQPLDAGIIRAFKAAYKKLLLRKIMIDFENEMDVVNCFKKIKINDAIILSKWAWDSIKIPTIINCWIKTSLINESSDNENEVSKCMEKEICELKEIEENIKILINDNPSTAEEYINIENEYNDIDLNNFIEEHSNNKNSEDTYEELDLDLNENKIEIKNEKITFSDATESLKKIESYFLQNSINETGDKFLKYAYDALYKIMKSKQKQGTILDFLNK